MIGTMGLNLRGRSRSIVEHGEAKMAADAYSSPSIAPARFEHLGIVAKFPMNVIQTRFGDSAQDPSFKSATF